MDKANSKILTLSFVAFAALVGFTLSTTLRVLSGAFGPVAKAMNYDMFRHGLPVAVALGLFAYLQFNKNVLKWGDEVIVEIKKVVWPPAKDTRGMTIIVIIMVIISSAIVTMFDAVSAFFLNLLMK